MTTTTKADAIKASSILYNSYRFSAANTARVDDSNANKGQLTPDGKLGFDCSGFVYFVLSKSGYNVEYLDTTRSMSSNGTLTPKASLYQTKIEPEKAQAGDLVYFNGHVGIVVSYDSDKGTGIFRSSTTSKGVVDDTFSTQNKGYWGGLGHAFEGFTRVTAELTKENNVWADADTSRFPPLYAAPALGDQSDGSLWLQSMGMWESPKGKKNPYGDYSEENGNALGRYQLKTTGGLHAVGLTDAQGNWLGTTIAGVAVTSKGDFLRSTAAQDAAAKQYVDILTNELKHNGAWDYIGTVVGGELVTTEGLLAAAWLSGAGGAVKNLEQVDASGTGFGAGTLALKLFGQRLDQFRGSMAPQQSANSIAFDPDTVLPRSSPRNPSIPTPPLASHYTVDPNGGKTYGWTASADHPYGLYKAGDVVGLAYDKNGKPIGMTILHLDGQVEASTFDHQTGLGTYLQAKDGVIVQQYGYRLDDPAQSPLPNSDLILGGRQYTLVDVNSAGQWVLRDKSDATSQTTIDPTGLTTPQKEQQAVPEAGASEAVRKDIGDDTLNFFDFDINLDNAGANLLGFTPAGDRGHLVDQLVENGFIVKITADGLDASRGDDHLWAAEDLLQMQVEGKWVSLNTRDDTVFVNSSNLEDGQQLLFTSIGGTQFGFQGSFAGTEDDFQDDPTNFKFEAIRSIGGTAIDAAESGLRESDLQDVGLTLPRLLDGELPDTVGKLLSALSPETNATNGWATPKFIDQDLGNGFTARSIQTGDGVTLSTIRNAEGVVVEIREAEVVGNATVERSYNAANQLQSTVTTSRFDDGSQLKERQYPDGSWVRETYDENGTLVATNGAATPLQSFGSAITDINALVQAIRTGKPLPIFDSGFRLLNDQINPVVKGTQTLNDQPLFTTTAVVGAISSLYGLHQTFSTGGHELDKVNASANALVAVSKAYDAVASQIAGEVTSTAVSGVANSVGTALPFLGAAVALEHGDYLGAAVAVVAYFVPVVGWIYAAYSLITASGNEPPQAWGTVRFKFGDGPSVTVDATGEGIGLGKVQLLTQGNGELPTLPDGTVNPKYFGGLLGYLNGVIDQAALANPDAQLGIIPQRLPQLTWREARQGDPGYALVDIDPITGEQRYPALRYDDAFNPFNADASDPAQRRDLFSRMVDSALARQAIAPMWEVRTARVQQDIGDPDAGLTEEERAANHGLSAPADANGKRLPGKFRPVALDLNGDGTITTVADAATDVSIDWDDSGYLKQTGWVGAGEGLLVIDRNLNGVADSGRELFSNGLVSDAAKGVRSMAWVDANADGAIDASDPVFAALNVWQDINQDGVQDASETHSLADLGITKLDYSNGRFTRNGQDYALQSPDLEASNDGVRLNAVQGGIQVDYSDGHGTLVITQVIDLGGGSGQGSSFVAQDDGVVSWEDGVSPGSDPTHPKPQQPGDNQAISISMAQLLANDAFNGVSTGLQITAVSDGQHGSAVINVQQGTVEFTPEHNYAGEASFQYTVTAPDGQTRMAKVVLELQAVADSPSISVSLDNLPVYGWGVLAHSEQVPISESYATVTTVERDKGLPQYAPYQTVMGQTYDVVADGESFRVEYGPLTDSGIPLAYFQQKYAEIARQQSGDGPPGSIEIMLDGQKFIISADPGTVMHDSPISTETSNDGTISAGDSGQFKYDVQQQGLYGNAEIDPNTGRFSYTGRRYVDQDVSGADVHANVNTDDHSRFEETHADVFQVKVTDLSDPSGNTFTLQDVQVTHFGPLPDPTIESAGGKKPIAVDLNGDGFHFTDVDDSNVFFDVNGDGWRRKIAWNNPADGFLAYDKNGDGKIDRFDELSFVPYKPDGQSDLESLRAFDSNGDGKFSAADEKWAAFGVWQDANSNGVTDAGEFKTLADMGIDSISLSSDGQFQVIDGQTVRGIGSATKTDGSKLALADVTLRYRNVTQGTADDGSTVTAGIAPYSIGQTFTGTADADLVFGTAGSDQYHMGDGNDVVNDDAGDDLVEAGAGDDIVMTGVGKDYVDGGDGKDSIFTGAGDDLTMAGAGDDFVAMGDGNDVAFGGDGNDMLSGGSGNDLLSGDKGDDQLFGEGGWDILFGMQGDDQLWGGDGNDQLDGGDGNDLLSGGAGADVMDGGGGNDTYEIDAPDDVIVEQADGGFDTVRASINYTLGDNLEGLLLVGTEALQGTGNAADNSLYGNDGNNQLYGLEGDDTLDGGLGADLLVGGAGNDQYVVDNLGDQIVETIDGGVDTVQSRISLTLAVNVENLTLIGINSINGTGNALNNLLIGNDAANTLDGGLGADEMHGGRGDDRYMVDDIGDVVTELAGEGYDTVISSLQSTVLASNVEALTLAGNAAQGVGNELDNTIIGTDGNNVLQGLAGNDILSGGKGDDRLEGGAGDDVLDGGDDIDQLDGGEGTNVLRGGAGNDQIYLAGQSSNTVRGDDGNDTIAVNLIAGQNAFMGINVITPGAGNDLIRTAAGSDTLIFGFGDGSDIWSDDATAGAATNSTLGSAGADTLVFSDGVRVENLRVSKLGNDLQIQLVSGTAASTDQLLIKNWYLANTNRIETTRFADGAVLTTDWLERLATAIRGTGGANTLVGTSQSDVIFGMGGNDTITGARGDDLLFGGDGDDTFMLADSANNGLDQYDGGSGTNKILGDGNYNTLNVTSGLANLKNIQVLDGGWLIDPSRNTIKATGGDDVLDFSAMTVKNFTIDAGAGNDTVTGTSGADYIKGGAGNDRLFGGDGDDTFMLADSANNGLDQYDGGSGINKILGDGNYNTLNVTSGLANLKNIQVLDGGWLIDPSRNTIKATGDDDVLDFSAMTVKNFTIDAGAGNDTVTGTSGADYIKGGAGNDRLFGGDGDDTFMLADSANNGLDQYDGGSGINKILGDGNYNTLNVASGLANLKNIQVLDGGWLIDPSRNTIKATGGNDVLDFSAMTVKNFTVDAGAGNDIITGTAATDYILGGDGDDRLIGGAGNDDLQGGNGNDVYVYSLGDGADTVTDLLGTNQLEFAGAIAAADLSLSVTQSNVAFILTKNGVQTKAMTVARGAGGQPGISSVKVGGNVYDVSVDKGGSLIRRPTSSAVNSSDDAGRIKAAYVRPILTDEYAEVALPVLDRWATMQAQLDSLPEDAGLAQLELQQPALAHAALYMPSAETSRMRGYRAAL